MIYYVDDPAWQRVYTKPTPLLYAMGAMVSTGGALKAIALAGNRHAAYFRKRDSMGSVFVAVLLCFFCSCQTPQHRAVRQTKD
jgi:hypothetical protein